MAIDTKFRELEPYMWKAFDRKHSWLLHFEYTGFSLMSSKKPTTRGIKNCQHVICLQTVLKLARWQVVAEIGFCGTWDLQKRKRSIGILYIESPVLPKFRYFENLYYSFIYSHISHGTLIWVSNYKSKLLNFLSNFLQKRALRAITFSDRKTPSRPLSQKLDIF